LIILGVKLKELGYNVTIMANQYDKNVVETFASNIIKISDDKEEYLNINEYVATWLNKSWDSYFNSHNSPDIILVGGWPFFSSIPFFKSVCKNVIFMDFGAVPLDGYSGGALIIQEKLRACENNNLKDASLIIELVILIN